MNYRRLGDSGVRLSEIGLGGWLTFGNAVGVEPSRAVMNAAFDAGINFFDTANAYARGECERVWGDLLRDHRREGYVLATKVFFPMNDGPNDRGLSRKHVTEQCHASLKRLRTDYIDLYQCHRFDDQTPIAETVGTLDDLVRQGKILYWGFSQWTPEQIEHCLKVCDEKGLERPKGSQPQYNLIQRSLEESVMPLCAREGIGQVVYSPLAQGVLSGKYDPDRPPPKDSRAADDKQNQFITKLVEDKGLLRKVAKLKPIAERLGSSMPQLALMWNLRRPEITSCIIGATRPDQVIDNAAASGKTLDPDVLAEIERVMG